MPDIHIRRDHHLGLAEARKIARTWAEEAEAKFDMQCTVIEGDDSDVVEFKRSGVSGQLLVAADHFLIDAKLGFLLGAFSKTIEAEITKNLDGLLSGSSIDGNGGGDSSGSAAASAQTPQTPQQNPRPAGNKFTTKRGSK